MIGTNSGVVDPSVVRETWRLTSSHVEQIDFFSDLKVFSLSKIRRIALKSRGWFRRL